MVEYKLSTLSAEKKEIILEYRDYMIYEMMKEILKELNILTVLARKL